MNEMSPKKTHVSDQPQTGPISHSPSDVDLGVGRTVPTSDTIPSPRVETHGESVRDGEDVWSEERVDIGATRVISPKTQYIGLARTSNGLARTSRD